MNNNWIACLLSCVVAGTVIEVIIAFRKWWELAKFKKLKRYVEWILTGGLYCSGSSYRELLDNVTIVQHEIKMPNEYRISNKSEAELCVDIIKEYQKEIVINYFTDKLTLIKTKQVVADSDYFMYSLYEFLLKHQCDETFAEYDMHKERISYKRYGDWGGPCYDASYMLSDFGVVYHKLLYITFLYCKESKVYNPGGSKDWQASLDENLKKNIDTKILDVWCGR